MDLISIFGILISVVIALWQYKKAKKAERELNKFLKKLPSDVMNNLGIIVTNSSNVKTLEQNEQPIARAFISYADINYDARNELLIQYPTGNHGITLKIYGFKEGEFEKLTTLGCGTPEGFQFADYDGDGKIEIIARETDWSAGLSYVNSPRMSIIYKWNGTDLEQIAEVKDSFNVSLKNINKSKGV